MTKFTLSQLKSYLNAKHLGTDAAFQSISTDSRTVQSGEAFIAIQGNNFDGHDFVNQVKAKGAVAAIVNHEVSSDLPLLVVSDTRKALGQLASLIREQMRIPLIAITGSNGKTTTKAMLTSILSQRGEVLANHKNYNNEIGVPLTLFSYTAAHRFAVLELGANHFGEIAHLTNIVKPNMAIILNIAPAHLEGFGDLQGVAKAKAEIFQGLAEDGVAIFNYEEPFADYFRRMVGERRIVTFGFHEAADIRADKIQILANGHTSFELIINDQRRIITLPILGEHNITNALAAAAAAHTAGIDIATIQQGLSAVVPVEKRLVVRQGLKNARVIDDSYSAIPNAVIAALQILARFKGKRIFVFGGMAELGEIAEAQHRLIGEQARALGIEYLLAIGPHSHLTVDAFGKNGHYFVSKQELIPAIQALLHTEVTVLIKGSRGARMEEIVESITDKKT